MENTRKPLRRLEKSIGLTSGIMDLFTLREVVIFDTYAGTLSVSLAAVGTVSTVSLSKNTLCVSLLQGNVCLQFPDLLKDLSDMTNG